MLPLLRKCGNTLFTQINLRELAKQGRIAERLFARLVGQANPLLQKVDSKQPLQPDRAATVASLWVVRLNQFAQRPPRHERVYFNQELRFPRRATVRRDVRRFRFNNDKASLFHFDPR